jgi:hypothetical protein
MRKMLPLVAAALAAGCVHRPMAFTGPDALPQSNRMKVVRTPGPAPEACSMALEVIPPIAGSGDRCWFRATYQAEACGGKPPAWAVAESGTFQEALESCSRPVTPAADGHGWCSYIASAPGEYHVSATAGDGTTRALRARILENGQGCQAIDGGNGN